MAAITVTDAGNTLLRDAVNGINPAAIKYVAIGTSNTTPTTSDTKLGAEAYRKKVSSTANGAAVGEALVNLYLAPGDAVGIVIAEVGFFGGNSASGSPNTGVLLARGLYAHTKTALESLQLQLDIIV